MRPGDDLGRLMGSNEVNDYGLWTISRLSWTVGYVEGCLLRALVGVLLIW